MTSKQYVKSLIVSDELSGRVLFDADIGNLVGVSIIDGIVLEVRGVNGTLRVDLREEELEAVLKKDNPRLPCSESRAVKKWVKN